MICIQVQNLKKKKKIVLAMSLSYTPVTQCIMCLTFLMYERTRQRVNYGGQESLKTNKQTNKQRSNLKFMVLKHLLP